jgi:hypothetical protein
MGDRVSGRVIEDLGKVKDAIGEWHDWEELASIAEKLEHGKDCRVRIELRSIAKRKHEHALALSERLRKTYVRNSRVPRKGAPVASPTIPRPPVWEATTVLAV